MSAPRNTFPLEPNQVRRRRFSTRQAPTADLPILRVRVCLALTYRSWTSWSQGLER